MKSTRLLPAFLLAAELSLPAVRAQSLPPGEGQAVVLAACVQCHDLRAVVSQRKDASAWRRTLNEMIWRGAPLLPGEVEVLTGYLASAFGPQAGPPPAASEASNQDTARRLPEGPGRPLVVDTCVGCHDLATAVNARKTPSEWRLSVARMVQLGARLNGSEMELIASYLAQLPGREP
jgi:cytochrome c553